MRKTLLTSATIFGLAWMPAAFAQIAAPGQASQPDQTAPAAAPDAATGTGMTGPAPKMHNHHIVHRTTDPDGTTFAHEPGTGLSGPASSKASNMDAADSGSTIAPHLPQPAEGASGGPVAYLRAADRALARHRTGEAQQALEMAETRLLDRSEPISASGQPIRGPVLSDVSQARQALAHGDMAGARSAIRMALGGAANNGAGGEPASGMAMHPMGMMQPGMSGGLPAGQGMAPGGMAPGMATSQPGGALMGNGMASSPGMSPSGAGPTAGNPAGAAVGGGPAGTGTTDSAGGAK